MGKKIKVLVAIAASIAVGVSFVPSNAFANQISVNVDNDYVDSAEKLGKLDKVTINYKQFIYEENNGNLKAIKYLGSDSTVEIPDKVNDEPVTEVADDVFDNANPDNLSKITNFKISPKLQKITSKVFMKLTNLKEISLSDSYDSNYFCKDGVLFDGRDGGTLICYPQAKSNEDLYIVPTEVKKIGSLAFYNASDKLTRIFIHDKVSDISKDAFNDAKLESIGVNSGNLTYFSDFNDVNDANANKSKSGVLYKKTSESTAEIAKYPQKRPADYSEGEVDQEGEVKLRTRIKMNNVDLSVTNIGDYAFQGVKVVTDLDMGTVLTSIGNYAFDNCTNEKLDKLSIPVNVTSVGEFAFNNCSSLHSIIINGGDGTEAKGVNTIGKGAFNNCTKLTAINVSGNSVYCNSLKEEKADGILYKKEIQSVEDTSKPVDPATQQYPMKDIEKDILVRFPCNKPGNITTNEFSLKNSYVSEIADYAFQGLQVVSQISLSDNIVKAGEGAFADCSKLTAVTDYDKIADLGSGAFENCQNLTNPFKLPASLTMVKSNLFKNCKSLTTVQIPTNIRYISNTAFENCKKLNNITIPKAQEGDTSSKFIYDSEEQANKREGCSYVTDDEGVLYIKDDSKAEYILVKYPMGKTKESYIVKPDIDGIPVSYIVDYAFKDCSNLKQVNIIKKVHTKTDYPAMTEKSNPIGIADDVFDKDCNISFTTQIFDQECFNYDTVDNQTHIIITKLLADADTVYIPSKIDGKPVTQIAENAFEGRKIKTLYIPASITKIFNDGSAVDKITGLNTLNIDASNTYYKAQGIKAVPINGNGGAGNDGDNNSGNNNGDNNNGNNNGGTNGGSTGSGDNRGLFALGSVFLAAIAGLKLTKNKKNN